MNDNFFTIFFSRKFELLKGTRCGIDISEDERLAPFDGFHMNHFPTSSIVIAKPPENQYNRHMSLLSFTVFCIEMYAEYAQEKRLV
jgi:hypothetical protein